MLAWAECGIHPFNRVWVMSNPKWPLLFRADPESPPPQDGPRQNPQHRRPPPTEMEHLRATAPNTIEESRSQIGALGDAAQKLEAGLAVAKAELH